MSTADRFDLYAERLAAGEPLAADDIRALAASPDILALGMLADTLKRRIHGNRVTFLRVAVCAFGGPFTSVHAAARELRLTGSPATLNGALEAVAAARAAAGTRTLSGFTWSDVEQIAGNDLTGALEQLRSAGLDAIAELALDTTTDPAAALEHVTAAGFQQARLTLHKAPPGDRAEVFLNAGLLRRRFPIVKAINPLPLALSAFRPSTGYDDVKMVALARLAAPQIRTVQVDWPRYGPKLAQVALSFGADDIDGISASDDAPDGRRRAPLEEIRRNIEAAGFEAVERDGRFGNANG
jgi:aminodeoxyfutalosine synthase